MEDLNKILFLQINSLAGTHHTLDFIGVISAEYMPYLFIIVLLSLFFSFKKKYLVIFSLITMFLAIVINKSIGLFYYSNQPFMDDLGITLVNNIEESFLHSNHNTFIFSIAIYIYISIENKILGGTLLILAFIGGVSRIYIGAHYPLDIISSITTALVASIIIYKLKDELIKIYRMS